jgi:hypothetical protein
MSIVGLLIYLIVIGVVIALVYYITTAIPIPEPLGNIIRVVAMVVGCLIIILLLLQLVGVGTGLTLPKV